MTPIVSSFKTPPDGGRGFHRDMQVRWALEEVGDLLLFESGAIVHHIAQTYPGLLPLDPNATSRAVMWMFAALNTIEPTLSSGDTLVCPAVERRDRAHSFGCAQSF